MSSLVLLAILIATGVLLTLVMDWVHVFEVLPSITMMDSFVMVSNLVIPLLALSSQAHLPIAMMVILVLQIVATMELLRVSTSQ
jgi:cytochrome b subunit of formate dehydrogenase